MTPESLPLAPAVVQGPAAVSTATIATVLLKKGLRKVWLRGTRPLDPSAVPQQPRVVGRALMLRFVPARDDLATPASWAAPISSAGLAFVGWQEPLAGWMRREVERGVPLPGRYPAKAGTAARYPAWVAGDNS